MKIKTKLALRFALIIGSILLFFSVSIYYFSSSYRLKEFQKRLQNRAITNTTLLENVAGIDSSLLHKIDKNTVNLLFEVNNFIYNYDNKLLYKYNESENPLLLSNDILNSIKQNGSIKYREGLRDVVGISYPKKNPKYIIICSAIDFYGINVLNNLKLILGICLLVSLLLIIISALLYSREALKPISNIIKQVDTISANNLSLRVDVAKKNDEISTLAFTFNNMLDRIEESFESQRSFVSNASHELRTPLTIIKGQIDVALMKQGNMDEHTTSLLNSINADVNNLTLLINGFLEMAEANANNKPLKKDNTRVDELLYYVKNDLHNKNKNYVINISFDNTIDDDELKLLAPVNLIMMKRLFYNLIDNACKFSNNNTANIIFQYEKKYLIINIEDNGIGIPANELNDIINPFYRAGNAKNKNGHGIGLSIANVIINLHKGKLEIYSEINKGTKMKVYLPYL